MNTKNKILYSEYQPCRSILIWLITVAVAGYIWFATYHQIILGNPAGTKPAPDLLLVFIWIVFGILFPLAVYKARLSLKIDSKNFTYKFFPLHLNTHSYPVQQIQNIEPVHIRPILHFGGWGIRFGFKGKGYIMKGGKGVKVSFKSGRPIYFSANDADSIVESFQKARAQ